MSNIASKDWASYKVNLQQDKNGKYSVKIPSGFKNSKKYLKYAIDLMRKATIRIDHTFQRKIKLLIYPQDRIEPITLVEFLSTFFTEIDDKTLFSNFDLMYVPKKEVYNYSAPTEPVKFFTDKEIEKMVNQTSKQQSNKEKKQLIERKDYVHKDSFFDMKKDDGVDYLSSVFTEKVEFEE